MKKGGYRVVQACAEVCHFFFYHESLNYLDKNCCELINNASESSGYSLT